MFCLADIPHSDACAGNAQRSGLVSAPEHALTIQGNLQINPGSEVEGPFHSGASDYRKNPKNGGLGLVERGRRLAGFCRLV